MAQVSVCARHSIFVSSMVSGWSSVPCCLLVCLSPCFSPSFTSSLSHSTCTLTCTPSSMWTAPRETHATLSPNEEYCLLAIYNPPTDWQEQGRNALNLQQAGFERAVQDRDVSKQIVKFMLQVHRQIVKFMLQVHRYRTCQERKCRQEQVLLNIERSNLVLPVTSFFLAKWTLLQETQWKIKVNLLNGATAEHQRH